MYRKCTVLMVLLNIYANSYAGEFKGELKLVPDGCQFTDSRICQLGSMLTFRSTDGLVWQTDVWKDGNGQSGTTDGASIPKWAQPIIGDAYDESFLKAAIVHDHYCYQENHVRTWRQTHRMFYDALIDLGVDRSKAKVMYFAVYAFGPHWVELVSGEECGESCIKSYWQSGEKSDDDQFSFASAQKEIAKFKEMIDGDQGITILEIERYARLVRPNDFYLGHGDAYTPTGKNDPNLLKTY